MRRSRRRRNPAAVPAVAPVVQANPRRRRARRAKRSRRRRKNPIAAQPTQIVVRMPNPRRSRRTGKFVRGKERRRSRRGRVSTRSQRKGARRVGARRRNTRYRSVSGYRRKGSVRPHRRRVNPISFRGLMSNQGPFSRGTIRDFGGAALGVGLGLAIADGTDRFFATMAPSNGQHAWFGGNAAAAIQKRPDAIRLGVQGLGAVVSMALAYVTRNMKVLPWVASGTAVGFGANLGLMGWRWYLAPMLLKAESGTSVDMGNRLYSMEQTPVQDQVASIFENLTTAGLQLGQSGAEPVGTPIISGTPFTYALGKPGHGQNGKPRLIDTGRLGMCAACGGNGGCYENCPDLNCAECPGAPGDRARYEVEPGDDMTRIAEDAGVAPAVLYGLNGGRQNFRPGEDVIVPHALGRYLFRRDQERQRLAGVPQQTAPQAGAPESIPVPKPVGNGAQHPNAAMLMMMPEAS